MFGAGSACAALAIATPGADGPIWVVASGLAALLRSATTGAVVGGVLLGLVEAIGAGYLGELTGGVLGSHYADIFAFVALILVLTLRPSGLLGERVADRA